MNQTTKKLGLITLMLFIMSLTTYYYDNKRGSADVSGTDLITGLNIEKIQSFSIKTPTEEFKFQKENDIFLLSSHEGFSASNEKVNELLYKLASIKIREKLDNENFEKYKVDDKAAKISVTLFDKNGAENFKLFIGDDYKTKGTYVRISDKKNVFITEEKIAITATRDSFIDRDILKLSKNNVDSIDVNSAKSFKILNKDNKFVIANSNEAQVDESKINSYIAKITSVKLKNYFKYDSNEVNSLSFPESISLQTKDKIFFELAFAKSSEKYYLKVSSKAEGAPQQVVINKDDNKEKLLEVDKLLRSKNNSEKFNIHHGSWIYEINKVTYDGLFKDGTNQFLKDKS